MIPRPSGRPVAPSPLRVGAKPEEKTGTLVGVAAPKPEVRAAGAADTPKARELEPAPTTVRTPEPPPPSSRSSLDAKPLLPARTPNRIAIVQGASISAAMRAAPVATIQPTPAVPPPAASAAPAMPPIPAPAPMSFDKTLALPNAPKPRPSSPGPRFDKVARWSQPQLATPLPMTRSVPPPPSSEEPLTYQVFSPSTIAATPMPSMRSGSIVIPPPKASLGARVCMALVAVCVVLGTAIIVTLGSDEHATKAAATNAIGVVPTADPPPPVSTVVAPPATIETPAPPPPSTPTPGTIVKTKTKGPPRSIKNAKPPPNPYEGATAKR